jgi:hypothetical protein
MKELVEKYLCAASTTRGGMPTERAIGTTDGSRISRPLAPWIALQAAVSGVHFITPPSRQVRKVHHSVCLMS